LTYHWGKGQTGGEAGQYGIGRALTVHRVARDIAQLADSAVAQPLEPVLEDGFDDDHADGMVCHVRGLGRANILIPHRPLAGFVTECQSPNRNLQRLKLAGFAPKSLAGFRPKQLAGFAPK